MSDNKIAMQPEESYKIIRNSVLTAQSKVYTVVNSAMVQAYWEIGQEIHKACGENDRAEYGKKLLQYLSEQLTKEFGKGFTVTNLKYMRQFYRAFPIRHTLCDELSWSHYRLLMRIEDEKARKFYAEESVKSKWSVRQLEKQMQMYVNYYTREMMNEGDNPPIGIVLCADKSDQVVKYTLPEDNNQIFASKYKLYLPTEEEFKKELNLENYLKKDEEEEI